MFFSTLFEFVYLLLWKRLGNFFPGEEFRGLFFGKTTEIFLSDGIKFVLLPEKAGFGRFLLDYYVMNNQTFQRGL